MLFLCGHGNEHSIALAKKFSITTKNVSEIAIKYLADKALFIFYACKSKNLAKALAQKAKELRLNMKILASREFISDYTTKIWFKIKNNDFKLKTAFFNFPQGIINITYTKKN